MPLITPRNKKVLLRERKRHTARRVVSTPSVVLPGYPPGGVPGPRYPPRGGLGTPGGVPGTGYPPRGGPGYPPGGLGTPRGGGYWTWVPPRGGTQTWVPLGGYPDLGTPPGGVPGPGYPPTSWHSGKCCKALWDMGTPPCGQTDWWMDRRVSKHYLPSYYVRGR